MGFIKKIKDIFIEEDEMDKTKDYTRELEVTRKIEIEDKDTEIELETTITERELYKSPSTFKFPVVFEEDLNPKKEDTKRFSLEKEKQKNKEDEEEKKFKSSPIISPVYGILDKNYNKDEINNKSDQPDYESKRNYGKINIDTIRQKAFGTLEEDLEDTIMNDNNFIYGLKEEEKEEVKDPIAEEMGLKEEDISIEKAYEDYTDYGLEYKAPIEEEEKHQKTEVLDDDLFNLINSMYKNEEEDN